MKNIIKFLISVVLITAFTSCNNDPKAPEVVDFTEANETEIQAYIKTNDLEAKKTASGLYYLIEEEGTGENPKTSDRVKVAYKGFFTNGKTFDESSAEGIAFGLNQVIRGWTEGIPLFKTGGKGKLIIPSRLAYGNRGRSSIPGGAVLVFDIHLLDIVK